MATHEKRFAAAIGPLSESSFTEWEVAIRTLLVFFNQSEYLDHDYGNCTIIESMGDDGRLAKARQSSEYYAHMIFNTIPRYIMDRISDYDRRDLCRLRLAAKALTTIPFRLMSLPQEVRARVFKYVVLGNRCCTEYCNQKSTLEHKCSSGCNWQLKSVSKQIGQEFWKIHLQQTTFALSFKSIFTTDETLSVGQQASEEMRKAVLKWAAQLRPHGFRFLQSVELRMRIRCRHRQSRTSGVFPAP
ncbi:hypothetical protein K431DRAFT_308919 [Polychaeton citri CBS 116435]|uniref:Uncharacterized protein n=1 Tax=Polychaeton citri CBS 116435 TaxID=1314669 RepID=A0A9P4QHJ2_9PEZI|nr:hypothetical protein K431DRAFT_308919 [Polychaeton citri CBS 116435]